MKISMQNIFIESPDTLIIGLDRFMSIEKFEPISQYLEDHLKQPVKVVKREGTKEDKQAEK